MPRRLVLLAVLAAGLAGAAFAVPSIWTEAGSGDWSVLDPITPNVGNNPITQTYAGNETYLVLSACTYSLSPLDLSNTPATGGAVSITITTPSSCPVTATSYQPWVAVNGIISNGGTKTVSLQISPNAGAMRATTIVVAERLFLITQVNAPPAKMLINEIATGTTSSSSDEFVELFNVGGVAADIGGYKLVYRTAAGTSDVLLATLPAGTTVAAGGYYLFGGTSYAGAPPADQSFTNGLASTAGGIGLRDSNGTLVDSVGYGATATNAFVETAPAAAPPTTATPGPALAACRTAPIATITQRTSRSRRRRRARRTSKRHRGAEESRPAADGRRLNLGAIGRDRFSMYGR
jgi:hypothetical protein